MAQRVKQGDDVAFSVFVEVAGRLVGEQHAGTIDERPRDSYPSMFAAGQLGGISVHPLLQSHTYEQGRRARIRMGDRHCPTEQCGQDDVVDRPEIRQQARKLEDEAELTTANPRQLRLRQRPDVGAVQQHPPRGRSRQCADHREERRFSRSRSADNGDELAALQKNVCLAHCGHLGAVTLVEAGGMQDHRAASCCISTYGSRRRARHAGTKAPAMPRTTENSTATAAANPVIHDGGHANGMPIEAK